MITVTLDAAELLVLADALRAADLPGLDLAAPDEPAARRALMLQGQASLEARGLAGRDAEGALALDEALALIGGVIAYPELLCAVTLRDQRQSRRLLYAYCDGLVVELEPQAGQVRLSTFAGLAGLLGRLRGMLPDLPDPQAAAPLLITPEGLAATIAALSAGEAAAAGEHLAAFAPAPGLAERLLMALAQPELRGSLTLLRYRGRELIATRSPRFVVGAGAAWWIAPALDGAPTLGIEGLGTRRLMGALVRQLRRLGIAPRAA